MNLFDLLAGPGFSLVYGALPIAFVLYFLLLFDARRKDSPAAADTQLGIKTVAATIAVVGTIMFAMGLQAFLQVLLTFDEFLARMKAALPNLLFGGLGVIAAAFVLFPKTNAATYPKAKRLAAGVIAIVSGIATLPALAMFLQKLLAWSSWDDVAQGLSSAIATVVVFGASFAVLAKLSGIDVEKAGSGIGRGVAGPPQQPGYPPQQAPGYPPQQAPGGYPPQQAPGGYPPQHPGMPQQGQPMAPPQSPMGPGWGPPGGGG